MEKGGNASPLRSRWQEHLLSWQGHSAKAGFFTISAQVTGFKTVTGNMGQIYCTSEGDGIVRSCKGLAIGMEE